MPASSKQSSSSTKKCTQYNCPTTQGLKAYQDGNYEQAISILEECANNYNKIEEDFHTSNSTSTPSIEDPLELEQIYLLLGNAYYQNAPTIKAYELSLSYYIRALARKKGNDIEDNRKYLNASSLKDCLDFIERDEDSEEPLEDINIKIDVHPKIELSLYYQIGLSLNGLKRYDEAIKAFTVFIKDNSPDDSHYYHRAIAYKLNEEYQNTIDDLTSAIDYCYKHKIKNIPHANIRQYYFERGLAYLNNEPATESFYYEAISDFTEAINISTEKHVANHQILYNRGLAHFELKQYLEAEQGFKQAIDLVPENNKVPIIYYLKLADTCYALKMYQEALSNYDRAFSLNKDKAINLVEQSDLPLAEYYFNRGKTKFRLNDYKSAKLDFKKAISLPEEIKPLYYFYLGLIAYHNQYEPDNLKHIEKSVKMEPMLVEKYFQHIDAENKDDYIDDIKLILSDKEDIDRIYFHGVLKLFVKDYDGAITDFKQIINSELLAVEKRCYFYAHLYVGLDSLKNLGYTAAKTFLVNVLDSEPRFYDAYKGRIDSFETAVADFKKHVDKTLADELFNEVFSRSQLSTPFSANTTPITPRPAKTKVNIILPIMQNIFSESSSTSSSMVINNSHTIDQQTISKLDIGADDNKKGIEPKLDTSRMVYTDNGLFQRPTASAAVSKQIIPEFNNTRIELKDEKIEALSDVDEEIVSSSKKTSAKRSRSNEVTEIAPAVTASSSASKKQKLEHNTSTSNSKIASSVAEDFEDSTSFHLPEIEQQTQIISTNVQIEELPFIPKCAPQQAKAQFVFFTNNPKTTQNSHIKSTAGATNAYKNQKQSKLSQKAKQEIGRWGEEYLYHNVDDYIQMKYPDYRFASEGEENLKLKNKDGSLSTEQAKQGFKIYINSKQPEKSIKIIWYNKNRESYKHKDLELIEFEGDKVVGKHYFEIKTTQSKEKHKAIISGPEWLKMLKHSQLNNNHSYSFFRIYNAGKQDARIELIEQPLSKMLSRELEIKAFSLKV